MAKLVDMTGQRWGRLTVDALDCIAPGGAMWRCTCACGRKVRARGYHIRTGKIASCGCLLSDVMSQIKRTHGQTETSEYRIWGLMRQRCGNPSNASFKDYGARGIRVCSRWEDSFEAFFADMGPRPTPKHTIERKDNNAGYSPSNCIWATRVEQNNNTRRTVRLSIDGKDMSLAVAARVFGVEYSALYWRLHAGWSVARAIGKEVTQ
jgi:hypothetical protein